ncbi:MAG: tyrosine-protein phosphatase [Candidatus Geothermincolia bacterium]
MTEGVLRPGAAIAAIPNMRDLGGWPAGERGHVRYGLLYRSAAPGVVKGEAAKTLDSLGIRYVYDLRVEAERRQQPDRVPPGVDHVVIDIFKDSTDLAPAQLREVAADPELAEEMLGDGQGIPLFESAYREVLSLPSAMAGYRRLFSDLSREEHRPALFHCTTGKDRTGWAAASMLMLLGVPDELVMQEYLLTNEQLLPALKPVFDRFESLGGDPELLRPILGVRREYLEAALDEMRHRYGTVEGYFTEGLGLDADILRHLRATFIEPSA